MPRALAVTFSGYPGTFSEWDSFYAYIKQNYPIQWFFRYYLTSWDNPIYKFIKLKVMKLNELKYATKRFFSPLCPRWRKSFPRYEYRDVCSVIENSNFALILDFWYEDVLNGFTNWNSSSTPHVKKFYKELEKAIKYIEVGRKELQQKLDEALDESSKKKAKPYNVRYGKYNKLEQKLKDSDTTILVWAMTNRHFFWD